MAFVGPRDPLTPGPSYGPAGARAPLVALKRIDKSFGSLRALHEVSADFRPGELHCILGENGAGKSTLMKILAGVERPDSGELELRGVSTRLRNRRDGIRAGVGIVLQHHGLIEQLTGVENFLLNAPNAAPILNPASALRKLAELADQYRLDIRPQASVGRMTTGERQRLEIVIALAAGSELLILDEPTSALPTRDVDRLIDTLRALRAEGKALAYITHKLREVVALADRATVLRRGRVVAELSGEEIEADRLTAAMMGELPPVQGVASPAPGAVVARLDGVCTNAAREGHPLHDVSLEIREGEIVGVGGMLGAGQEDLARVLAGLTTPTRGRVEKPPVVGYLPEDRAREGVAEKLTVLDNLLVHVNGERALHRGPFIDRRKATAFANRLVAEGDVRGGGLATRAGLLSGGNQQKLVVARELDRRPKMIVAHNPYRGLDVNATRAVRLRLLEARGRGCAILLISPDLEDLFEICDRIVVLSEGALTREVDPSAVSARELGVLVGEPRRPAP